MSFVYRNKFAAMKNAGLAWLLMIVCLAIYFWPHSAVEPTYSHLKRLAFGVLGAPVCMTLFVLFIREWRAGAPVLKVDDTGVTIRFEPTIPWDDVESVRSFTRNSKEYIGVYARDVDRWVSRFPGPAGQRFKSVQERMGAVAVVAQESLPISVDDVMKEIGNFCQKQVASNQSAHSNT